MPTKSVATAAKASSTTQSCRWFNNNMNGEEGNSANQFRAGCSTTTTTRAKAAMLLPKNFVVERVRESPAVVQPRTTDHHTAFQCFQCLSPYRTPRIRKACRE
eukprot:CAMPEP_0194753230 /NCGR_PEP_ID=MMETSP0323_2-20130528/7186_1 /TAXON_ID=2866 ORGANISM="Crypthecodinium cohnii, Strain Seligo" /NCGR_SAMPLE_ID=MMETSP0323_2 /ASSEMBLY_ACC=CAM_ASM_000346 /LENGTH=102 /DNA_ID=CAMNT_0039670939 /DNA_START=59 /DNA_END=364 /DNA_ORIENTATION=+